MERQVKLCVIGDPVEHSKSPVLQNAMLAALGLPAAYGTVRVAKEDTAAWLKRAKAEGYTGFNATMPHKLNLVPLVDTLGPDAKRFGAVNSVSISADGTAEGYNTDGRGFLRALLDMGVEPQGRTICLLGAGGAAKAVALKLAEAGAEKVIVCNRTVEKAETLCALDASGVLAPAGFDGESLKRAAGASTLMVNCTSLGMTGTTGQFEDLSFVDCLLSGGGVFDLIYSPAETALLARARRDGLPAANGLGMLLYQGVFALEHFLHEKLDEAAMAKAAREALK
ncbi:MAG: shikimate dehydrogenase [Oscillospiraceae bacterium]|nr:shikimate dehydrogenase [Oscillospiraceae bacterium]